MFLLVICWRAHGKEGKEMAPYQSWGTKDAASTALDSDTGGSGQTFEGDLQGHQRSRAVRVEKKGPPQYESDKRQAPLMPV